MNGLPNSMDFHISVVLHMVIGKRDVPMMVLQSALA